MFSLFRSSDSPKYEVTDKVWKTETAAFKGLLTFGLQNLQSGKPTLVLSFFDDDRERLSQFMSENKIGHATMDVNSGLRFDPAQIYLLDSDLIERNVVTNILRANGGMFQHSVYFHGHYPLPSVEDQVLKNLADLGYKRFVFCLSFDDPTLKLFGSDRIVPVLEKLGLDENEGIEHAMVTKAIKNARRKIEEKVLSEKKAKSSQEWFDLNHRTKL